MIRNLIILPDGTEIFSGNSHDNAIISAKYIQTVNADEDIALGAVCANVLKMTLVLSAENLTIAAGTEFEYYTVADDGTREKVGLFTMGKPTRASANNYKVEAYDRISWLDKDLTLWLEKLQGWPYKAIDFAKLLFPACGLTLATTTLPNSDQMIRKFSADGITGRQLAKWLGEIFGKFCRANKNGEIEYAWYEDNGASIEPSDIFAGTISYEDYQVQKIEKVQIQGNSEDIGTIYPDNTDAVNTYKITSNYLLTAETADELKPLAKSLLSAISDVTYTPAKLSINADTSIRAGDIIHVTDRNGAKICVYVMSKTVSGQKATLECTGNTSRDSVSAVNEQSYSALYGKVLNVASSVEGLRIENADTAGKVAKLELNVDNIELGVSEATTKAESAQATADEAVKNLNNYAESVAGSLTDLQNQIDGAIETWFYNYRPTTKNAPASAWTTTEDKNKHLGDLFYIVDNNDLGGQIYRWALVNGAYEWVLVEDTEVAKALETAAQAKDTADGKRRVFVAQPKPPYDVGDLWTDGADLRVCKTARASGSYTASDWELATEYIDAEVAQAKADAAEKSANAYASAQIKIAKDSILQSVESQYTTKTDFSKAVTSVQEQYYRSVSASTTVGGSWSTSEPAWAEGIYVWNRRLVTYGDGTTGYEPSDRGVCVTGNTGAKGDTGNGIKSITEYYQVSTSNTTAPTSWATTPPALTSTNKYLWNYETITYTSGSTASTEKRVIGVYGDQGTKGDAGRGIKSTATTYQAGASGTTAPTGTWTTSVPAASASAPYLWTRTIITYTDGTTSTAYAVGSTLAGVNVGGRNLVVGASKYRESTPAVTGTADDAYVYLTDTSVQLENGKVYTLQACCDLPWSTAHGSGAGTGKGTIWIASADRKYHRVFVGDGVTSGRYTWTFTHAGDTGEYQLRVNGYVTPAKFWDMKVESGNIPTDWTPAPEDVNASIEDVNVRTINNTASIENLDTQIALRATTEELNTAVTEQNQKLEAALVVASDAIRQEVTKSVEKKIADGDDALAAKYEEIRTYLDFTTDGLYLGKSGNDTIMHIINNAIEILVAGVAGMTLDTSGLTAPQANIRTLHMGNFTLSVSESGNTLSLS